MRALLPSLFLAAVGGLIVQTSSRTNDPTQVRVGPLSFEIGRSVSEPGPGRQPTAVTSSEGWKGLVLIHEGQQPAGPLVPACEAEFALDLDLGEIEGILRAFHTQPAAGVSIPPAPAIQADLELFRELYRTEALWPRALPDPSTVS